jgi:hypothetical protein
MMKRELAFKDVGGCHVDPFQHGHDLDNHTLADQVRLFLINEEDRPPPIECPRPANRGPLLPKWASID